MFLMHTRSVFVPQHPVLYPRHVKVEDAQDWVSTLNDSFLMGSYYCNNIVK